MICTHTWDFFLCFGGSDSFVSCCVGLFADECIYGFKFCLFIQGDWMIPAALFLALLHIYVVHLMFQFLVGSYNFVDTFCSA